MPRYSVRKNRTRKRKQKKITKGFTRDKRILKRWAANGTNKDYEKLRRYADTYSAEAPEYVLPTTMDELATIDRGRLISKIHDEPHGGSWFMDGLNWLIGFRAAGRGSRAWGAQQQNRGKETACTRSMKSTRSYWTRRTRTTAPSRALETDAGV